MENKAAIRKRIRTLRSSLTEQQTAEYSRKICQNLIKQKELCQFEQIFVYSSTQNEADLTDFIRYSWEHEIKIAFPKVHGQEMDFYEVVCLEQLEAGAFGILEPNASCNKVVPSIKQPFMMLVPGVAFSEKGYRIGFGKGFYDRYLARYPQIHTIGIAYENQICKEIPADEFDIPMDRIITEEREVVINEKFGTIM